jgi:uracil-DNA glycosylase
MNQLLKGIRSCEVCKDYLDLGCRPVLRAHKNAKIAIIGQAPGTKVHASGIPWDDQSGKRLRAWIGISDEVFYDEQ